ncbi:MAG: SpoIIE family protein phosphatase [Firmicutes bacterium]|nr:SpoIIE family protein phosphatase [Bacillota bacterium]
MIIRKNVTSETNNAAQAFTDMLSLLIESARSISGKLPLQDLENIIIEEAKQVFRANAVWLLVYDSGDDLLRIDRYWGPGEEMFKGFTVKPGIGIPGKVFLTQQPEIIFEADPRLKLVPSDKISEKDIPVLVAYPLTVEDRKIGVFGFSSEMLGKLGIPEAEIDFLVSAFVNHIAAAMDTAHVFEEKRAIEIELKNSIQSLQTLNDLAQKVTREADPNKMADKLADAARLLLNSAYASVLLYNETEENFLTISWSEGATSYTEVKDFNIKLRNYDGLYGEMYRTKKPIRLNDISPNYLSKGLPKGHATIRGLLGAPLLDSNGNFMGHVIVTNKLDGLSFTKTDEELLTALCAHVSVAIERAQAYEKEHTVAEALQQAILAIPRNLPGIELGIVYESAAEIAKVGGDFYDLFDLGGGKVGILVGDVSGKGLEAATITSMVKSTIRAFAYMGISPASVLSEANKVISWQLGTNKFVTVIYGVLDLVTGKLVFSRAGHPDIIIWRNEQCELCEVDSNLPLGIFSEVIYDQNEIDLAVGDGVILYTDGLVETMFKGQTIDEQILIKGLSQITPGKSPQDIAYELVSMAKGFTSGRSEDDIAVMVLRRAE